MGIKPVKNNLHTAAADEPCVKESNQIQLEEVNPGESSCRALLHIEVKEAAQRDGREKRIYRKTKSRASIDRLYGFFSEGKEAQKDGKEKSNCWKIKRRASIDRLNGFFSDVKEAAQRHGREKKNCRQSNRSASMDRLYGFFGEDKDPPGQKLDLDIGDLTPAGRRSDLPAFFTFPLRVAMVFRFI